MNLAAPKRGRRKNYRAVLELHSTAHFYVVAENARHDVWDFRETSDRSIAGTAGLR